MQCVATSLCVRLLHIHGLAGVHVAADQVIQLRRVLIELSDLSRPEDSLHETETQGF